MSAWSHAHLMFCEGPHDAAFLNRVLKKQLDFEAVQLLVSQLPYPIGNVLKQSFKNRAAEDLRLDLAKKFFMPDYLLQQGGTLVLVFNYGGANRPKAIPPFLEELFVLLQAPMFSDGLQVPLSYLVFADADVLGTATARNQISTDLQNIGGEPWLKTDWHAIAGSRAAQQSSAHGPVASYIWRQWGQDYGTLEDVVLECLSDNENIHETLAFVDAHFDWTLAPTAKPDKICANAAKRLKAAFCVEGQQAKPGGSLGVILDQGELLTAERLAASQSVQDCVAFLRAWLDAPQWKKKTCESTS